MEMADEGNYRKKLRDQKIDFLVSPRKIESLKSRLFFENVWFQKNDRKRRLFLSKKSNFKMSIFGIFFKLFF